MGNQLTKVLLESGRQFSHLLRLIVCIALMPPFAIDVTCNVVCVSVCLCVCVCVCARHVDKPAKTAEPIKIPLGEGPTRLGPWNHVLDKGQSRTNLFAAVR